MDKSCDLCGGTMNLEDHAIRHAVDCPNHPDAIDDTPVEPIARPAPARVASMAAARFDRAVHPEELTGRDALVAALDWWDACPPDDKPTHVIVLVGRDTPGQMTGSGTKFFQGGTYRHHAQMGLCLEAMHKIRESG